MRMNDPESPSPAPRERGFAAGLYRMLAWLSPGFPVGSFAFSHGLEATAASGAVCYRCSLQLWISAIVGSGGGRIDADILRDAHRASSAGDIGALTAANRQGGALRPRPPTPTQQTSEIPAR